MNERQKNKKKATFFLLSGVTILIGVLDVYLTYLGTPDLGKEGNLLVYTFGLGWRAFLTVNIISMFGFVCLYYYTFIRFERSVIPCKGFRQYLSMLFFGRADKFVWTLYRFPNSKFAYSYILASMGYIVAGLALTVRLLCVLEWVVIIRKLEFAYDLVNPFKSISQGTPFGRLDHVIYAIVLAIAIFNGRLIAEYRRNKKMLGEHMRR